MKVITNFEYISTKSDRVKNIHIPRLNDIEYPPLYKRQEDCLKKIIGNNFISIKMPTGSGKSTIILMHIYDLLEKSPKTKALVITPQKIITRNYSTCVYMYNEKPVMINPDILDSTNNIENLKEFLSDPPAGGIDSRIKICTHSSAVKLFKKLNNTERKKIFKNVFVWFDEAHHSSVAEYDDGTIENNILAELMNFLIENSNGVGLASATLYRSDNSNVVDKKHMDKFVTFKYDYYAYLNDCRWLKKIKYTTLLYNKSRKEAIEFVLKRKKNKKSTIAFYIPHARSKKMKCKYSEVEDIKRIAKKYHLSVLDLVHETTQDKNARRLNDLNSKFKKHKNKTRLSEHVDVIIALNMGKEGFDFLSIDTIVLLEDRRSLTDVMQTTGRALRDYFGKTLVNIFHILPGYLNKIDAEASLDIIKENIGAYGLALKMEDIITPLPQIKGCPEGSILETDDENYDILVSKIYDMYLNSIINEVPLNITVKQKWQFLKNKVIEILLDDEILDQKIQNKVWNRLKARIAIKSYKIEGMRYEIAWNDIEKSIDPCMLGLSYIKTFGYKNIKEYRINRKKEFLTYEECKKEINKIKPKIKSRHEYYKASKKDILPVGCPPVPNYWYRNNGWINWRIFLNKGNGSIHRNAMKKALLYLAKAGKEKPGRKTKGLINGFTGRQLYKYFCVCRSGKSEFYKELIKIRPDWVETTNTLYERKRETMEQMAKNMKKVPKKDGKRIINGFTEKELNSTFKEEKKKDTVWYRKIIKINPDWAKTDSDKKLEIMEQMARKGMSIPKRNSTRKINKQYTEDSLSLSFESQKSRNTDWYQKIIKINPAWKRRTPQSRINMQLKILENLALKGMDLPLPKEIYKNSKYFTEVQLYSFFSQQREKDKHWYEKIIKTRPDWKIGRCKISKKLEIMEQMARKGLDRPSYKSNRKIDKYVEKTLYAIFKAQRKQNTKWYKELIKIRPEWATNPAKNKVNKKLEIMKKMAVKGIDRPKSNSIRKIEKYCTEAQLYRNFCDQREKNTKWYKEIIKLRPDWALRTYERLKKIS